MRKKSNALIGVAISLTAFTAHAKPTASAKAGQNGCDARYSEPWTIPASNGQAAVRLTIEGISTGHNCRKANVAYVVRAANGRELFRESYEAEFMAVSAGATTPSQMRAALGNWVRSSKDTTFHANLPNWPVGSAAPEAREFPFTPDESVTREKYLRVKAQRTPARCYVQGMESINCVIYRGGRIEPFGLQAFPG